MKNSPIPRRCRRHGIFSEENFCYYCYRNALLNKLTSVSPEEQLLNSIFGRKSRYVTPIKRKVRNIPRGKPGKYGIIPF